MAISATTAPRSSASAAASRAAEAAVRSKDTGGTSLSAQGPRTRRAMFKMAAPAQGRRPLRVVSGLPRRSAGVGTLAQPAFSSVSRNTFPSSSSLRR